jgi:hypothetical protein
MTNLLLVSQRSTLPILLNSADHHSISTCIELLDLASEFIYKTSWVETRGVTILK